MRKVPCPKCRVTEIDSRHSQCINCRNGQPPAKPTPERTVETDITQKQHRNELQRLKGLYEQALDRIGHLEAERGVIDELKAGFDPTISIQPRESSGTSEAVPVLLASDWHTEERVTPAQSNGLNEFDLEIAERRIRNFFQSGLKLIQEHLNPGVAIHHVVLALLGDFIT